ncbi:hypothetical protein [Bacillus sp. FJAT-49736]|uniref:hypothetical protein n=1 Tax=Bacillus sp. FJAT-49736 TaxID=2833582 RepID=UPI001BCA1775|nr:hypothetical protein [Bacillus sp. FJAT-49736]MBS4174674.1 hypothetical protein [Bacillus sp. FJAT-49736]
MRTIYVILCTVLSISFLVSDKSFAKWAYPFVVWNGYIYVVNDEKVKEIGKEIGHVTKYSDREGTYSGNFSNSYKKGTKYYSIKGINTDEAIAVQDGNGKYVKATRDGKYVKPTKNEKYVKPTNVGEYESNKKSSEIIFLKWTAVFLVLVILIVTGRNVANRKRPR